MAQNQLKIIRDKFLTLKELMSPKYYKSTDNLFYKKNCNLKCGLHVPEKKQK